MTDDYTMILNHVVIKVHILATDKTITDFKVVVIISSFR